MSDHSYLDAIAYLTRVLNVVNGPPEHLPALGLGQAWGLQRGQAGWFHVVKCRNELETLLHKLIALHNQQQEAEQ